MRGGGVLACTWAFATGEKKVLGRRTSLAHQIQETRKSQVSTSCWHGSWEKKVHNSSIQILTIKYAWARSYLVCWISCRGQLCITSPPKNANAGGLQSVITFHCLNKTIIADFGSKGVKSDGFVVSDSQRILAWKRVSPAQGVTTTAFANLDASEPLE